MEHQFALRDGDFRKITRLVFETAGIVISDRKRAFIQSRLGRRLRVLGLPDFAAYCRVLETPEGDTERRNLINAITTNHTSFFREAHHFDYLAKTVMPELTRRDQQRVRIWSAGCSTGEEPYSIAMTLKSESGWLAGRDCRVLATDLDTNVVEHAARGVYEAQRIESVPVNLRRRFVEPIGEGRVAVSDDLKPLISFGCLNLLEPWPMKGPFDVIFCRNVVIYFDKDTQRKLFDRYADMLDEKGWLFVGHSESLMGVTDRFDLVGRTIYRRAR